MTNGKKINNKIENLKNKLVSSYTHHLILYVNLTNIVKRDLLQCQSID